MEVEKEMEVEMEVEVVEMVGSDEPGPGLTCALNDYNNRVYYGAYVLLHQSTVHLYTEYSKLSTRYLLCMAPDVHIRV